MHIDLCRAQQRRLPVSSPRARTSLRWKLPGEGRKLPGGQIWKLPAKHPGLAVPAVKGICSQRIKQKLHSETRLQPTATPIAFNRTFPALLSPVSMDTCR